VVQHRLDEMRVGGVERPVLEQQPPSGGPDHVEPLGQFEPDPVGHAEMPDDALLPLGLLAVRRAREPQRDGDRWRKSLTARGRGRGGEHERGVTAARERDSAWRSLQRRHERVRQPDGRRRRAGDRLPRSIASEHQPARGFERR
jgi:hypothetical protein